MAAAVLNHKALTVGGRVDVQRHVNGCALADCQLTHQQIDRALQQNRHAVARHYAQTDQVMRQLVGAQVQLRIAHRLLAMHNRQRIRRGSDTRLEYCMNRLRIGVNTRRRIKFGQHLLAFRRRQHGQLVQRRIRRLFKCLHQLLHRGQQIVAHPLGTDRRHHQCTEIKLLTQVIHAQRDRVVGALLGMQKVHAVPRLVRCSGGVRHGAVPVVEQRAEQRRAGRHAAATLGQRERSMLVPEQRREARMRGLDRRTHAGGIDIHAQRQGVDKHPQRAVGAFTALHAAQQHGAEHHVLAGRQAAQHPRPGQVKQAGGTHACQARLLSQTQAQADLQQVRGFAYAMPIALHVLHTERQGGFIDIAEHLAKEPLMLRVRAAQPRLRHVIAVRHRLAQLLCLPEQEQAHFLLHHVQRGVVHDQVMEHQQRNHTLVGLVVRVVDAHQRRLGQVEAIMTRIKALA
ncbi:hypothetical protein ALQ18_05168 [Pseudomonas marginalis pv. marginalis]|nr:hypothetical protein ALQ18_05168 [Pseudomonas marginalis pv. marginalis]